MCRKKISGGIIYASLSSIASTLPALATDIIITKPKLDTGYYYWSEGKNRYDIDTYIMQLEMPVSNKIDLTLSAERDTMSGASSALFVVENGELTEARSGASIVDRRNQVSVKSRYFLDNGDNAGVTVGYSTENDYRSFFVAPTYQMGFNKNNTVLTLGLGWARDQIYPKNSIYFYRLLARPGDFAASNFNLRKRKTTQKISFSLRQDLSKTLYGVIGGEYEHSLGMHDDPYKRALILGDASAYRPGASVVNNLTFDYDRRPTKRHAFSVVGRLVKYVTDWKTSFNGAYRYSTNTWGIKSHTFKLVMHKEFENGWLVAPSLRFYTQNAADFYAKVFSFTPGAAFNVKVIDPSEGFNSSDYRLSSFGNVTADLKIEKTFYKDNKVSLLFGYRMNRESLGSGRRGRGKHPANDYNTFYTGVNLSISDAGFMPNTRSKSKENSVEKSYYQRGMVSIRFLNANISTMAGSFVKPSTRIRTRYVAGFAPGPIVFNNAVEFDTFRAPRGPRGFGFDHGTRRGLSYGFELGYTIADNVEVFLRPSYIYEAGEKIEMARGLNFLLGQPNTDAGRTFEFEDRSTYALSFGLRKYFDMDSRWLPYIGIAAGFESQGATKLTASSFTHDVANSTKIIGDFEAQSRKNYATANLEFGLDYRLSENIAISANLGINYHQKPKAEEFVSIAGESFGFQDNHREFTFPVNFSMKFSF